ncbi:MAG: ATP-binding protein, partial [Ardenticatenaceae bacterium]
MPKIARDLARGKSVVSPILVGRAVQLEALSRALELVQGGQGQVVLLSGEAGVGKTRLIAEMRGRAIDLAFSTLQGNCFESERALPYAPLLDLLGAFIALRSPEEIAGEPGAWAPELARLLPELARLLLDLSPPPLLGHEEEKHRLFHALQQFFFHSAMQEPSLVVIEDIQWSDDTSLDFLLHLMRRLASWPLLLLLSYRTHEENASLVRFLAALERGRLAREIRLPPLAPDEVERMLKAIFEQARPVSAEFLNAICELTEGNPFFIEEVLKSLLLAGDIFYRQGRWDRRPMQQLRIPHSVQVAVQLRRAPLNPAARELLTRAAVVGRRFEFDLLQALSALDEPVLWQQLKELVSAQLIVEESAERYAFRHALTREAVYASLLLRERKRYHGIIAETIERLYADRITSHVDELAYHYYQAEAWEKALAFSQRAGERAQTLYAPREASELFTRALAAAHQLALPVPIALYRARGQAYETMGEFERAHADYDQALQMARAVGERQAEWQSSTDLGFLWVSKDYMKAGGFFRHALELALTLDDPTTLAHSLNRLGNWHLMIEQVPEARQCHAEALAIFERLNDRHGMAEALDLLGLTATFTGQLFESAAYYERSIALFRELDDHRGLASSLAILSALSANYVMDATAVAAVTLPEGLRYAARSLDIARQTGWRSGEAFALLVAGTASAAMGDYARALEDTHKALEIAEEIGHQQWVTFALFLLGCTHLDLLALEPARQYLERTLALARDINSPYWIRLASSSLASTYIQAKELSGAEAILDAALAPDAPLQTRAE